MRHLANRRDSKMFIFRTLGVPQGCGTQGVLCGREIVAPHQALEGGAMHPEGVRRAGDVAVVLLENPCQEDLFQLRDGLLPGAEAVRAMTLGALHDPPPARATRRPIRHCEQAPCQAHGRLRALQTGHLLRRSGPGW